MTAKPPLRPVPPLAPHPFRFTREQYLEMGRLGFFDRTRVERIRGEIVEMSPINWPHVVGCRKTGVFLERAFVGVAWVSRNEQPLALPDSDPQPDVVVVAGKFEDYSGHPTTALLVVEVSDSTLARDLTEKAQLYAEAAIPEYWVLDVDGRQLHVLRDPGPLPLPAELATVAYRSQQVLSPADHASPLGAPHVSIPVSDLLP